MLKGAPIKRSSRGFPMIPDPPPLYLPGRERDSFLLGDGFAIPVASDSCMRL